MENPRVLLISPPVYDFALFDLFLKPYGLLRLGRWLKDSGWEVDFIDALSWKDSVSLEKLKKPVRRRNGTGKFFRQAVKNPEIFSTAGRAYSRYGITAESLEKKISSVKKPDIIFITSIMTYWYEGVAEAVASVKKIWKNVPVAVGGIYATLLTDHCREKCGADFVVKRDGLDELREIFRKLSLPFPSTEPEEKLLSVSLWQDSAVLRLNKGCPLNCCYCASSLISDFAAGTPESVFMQFEEFLRLWNTANFAFYDDALLYKKDELFIPFLEKVVETGKEINFYLPNAVHVNYLDFETARLMKKAGFREIRLGFESSSLSFHEKNDRKVSLSSFENVIRTLIAGGFSNKEIIVYLLAGLPGQEAGEVRASIEYLKKFGVRISLSEFSPVPGSGLWEESVKKSIFPIEEEPLFQNNSIFPLQWEKFTKSDMTELKIFSRY